MAFQKKDKVTIENRTGNNDLRVTGPVQQLPDGRWVNCRHFCPTGEDPSAPRLARVGTRTLPTRVQWIGPDPHYHL